MQPNVQHTAMNTSHVKLCFTLALIGLNAWGVRARRWHKIQVRNIMVSPGLLVVWLTWKPRRLNDILYSLWIRALEPHWTKNYKLCKFCQHNCQQFPDNQKWIHSNICSKNLSPALQCGWIVMLLEMNILPVGNDEIENFSKMKPLKTFEFDSQGLIIFEVFEPW